MKVNNVVNYQNCLFDSLSKKSKRIIDSPQKEPEKESIFAFFKGSMSLEASLVVPIFLLFLMTIIYSIEIERLQTKEFEVLHQEYCERYETDDGIIELSSEKTYDSFTKWIPIGNIAISDKVYGHAFSGYSLKDGADDTLEEDEYVYITETGSKYHRSMECSYLNIHPNSVSGTVIGSMRNKYGGKYHACERCHPSKSGMVFITDDGDRYHSTTSCSSLKRTLNIILLSEALNNGYTPCSKCG